MFPDRKCTWRPVRQGKEILSFTVLTHLFSDTAGGEVRLLWVPILFQGLFLHFMQWLSNVSFIRDESRKDEIQHSVCMLTIKLHNLASFFLWKYPRRWEIWVWTTSGYRWNWFLHLIIFTGKDITQKLMG